MSKDIQVTIWNEYVHEKEYEEVKEFYPEKFRQKHAASLKEQHQSIQQIYPRGIHHSLAEKLKKGKTISVQTATLHDKEQGLTEEILDSTDVLMWWGHVAHAKVKDKYVERVYERVMEGMGLIPLHSAHASKIFRKLCGTHSQKLKWREDGQKERLWVIAPGHPIVDGIGECIELESTEMYGEHFDIPDPDKIIFISWFEGGEVFRSGCCYYRGAGKIFYFRPGHEEFPIYENDEIIKVLKNAVHWAAPVNGPQIKYGEVEARE